MFQRYFFCRRCEKGLCSVSSVKVGWACDLKSEGNRFTRRISGTAAGRSSAFVAMNFYLGFVQCKLIVKPRCG